MTDNIKLPPMPEWAKMDNLDCMSPSEIRTALNEFGREAVRLNAQAMSDGMMLVPVEPTLEMLEVGTYKIGVRDCYRAMLSAAPAAPQPAQQDAKPIYQYQLATGGWIDQTRDSYEYNKANGVKGLRIVYEAAPAAPAAQPRGLTLAAVGHKHFGNPIPPAWYAAAKELLSAAAQQPLTVPDGFVPQTCPHCNETWLMEAQQPLTDEQFQKIRRSLSQQSGWDGDGWDQALKEAIEQAHGIGVKP